MEPYIEGPNPQLSLAGKGPHVAPSGPSLGPLVVASLHEEAIEEPSTPWEGDTTKDLQVVPPPPPFDLSVD